MKARTRRLAPRRRRHDQVTKAQILAVLNAPEHAQTAESDEAQEGAPPEPVHVDTEKLNRLAAATTEAFETFTARMEELTAAAEEELDPITYGIGSRHVTEDNPQGVATPGNESTGPEIEAQVRVLDILFEVSNAIRTGTLPMTQTANALGLRAAVSSVAPWHVKHIATTAMRRSRTQVNRLLERDYPGFLDTP